MMVGKPGEGKPRHSMSLDLPVVPEMEWRGLPSPGSPTASSRLVHVFERYCPQAGQSGRGQPKSVREGLKRAKRSNMHGYFFPLFL